MRFRVEPPIIRHYDARAMNGNLCAALLCRAPGGMVILLWLASFALKAPAAEAYEERPFLAIWRDSAAYNGYEGPYLRIAIWNDGRILFAKDPKKWGHELLEGRIEFARLADLKIAVERTGVFVLKGNCYLVPDAPVDCVMVDLGNKQQMLYWDEVESPNYGINISPRAQHIEFKRCWKAVNALALAAIPKQAEKYAARFRPPKSWRVKSPIQSE